MLKIFRWCAAGLAWGLLLSLAAVAAEPATGYEVQAWNPRKPSPGLQATDLNGTVWRWDGLRGKVVLPDPQGAMARAWGITIFPSTVLVDAEGRVRSVLRGALDWTGADAERLLQPLFKSVRARP